MRPDSRRHGQSAPEDEDDFLEPPSKSSRKRDMHALQDLGEQLVALSPERLKKVPLPDALYEAIRAAQGFKMEARRRQLQYVGKLMRRVDVDADAIRAKLDVDDVRHRLETAVMHAAERWRDALIETPDRLAEFVGRHPAAAGANLHPLLRSARAEHAKQQRGRHYRELYRALRELLLADAMPAHAPTDDA